MLELVAILSLFLIDPTAAWPPLGDRDRFPPAHVCRAGARFARGYIEHLEGRASWDRSPWIIWAAADARWCHDCWDWCAAAQGDEGRDEMYWRYSLARLRELIGHDAYYRAELPPPVPLWFFKSID